MLVARAPATVWELPVEGGLLCGNLAMAQAVVPSQREAGDYA